MAAFNLKQYVKNVSKSAGYVAAETMKDLNPTITQFAETNSDALKEMYSAVRDYKKIIRDGKESLANSEYTKIAKETVSNFMDDLKTGNFYNKERIARADAGFGFDIDMGDFDFDDWNNIDENWGNGSNDEDTLTFSAMDDIGHKISTASGKAAMASADYVVKAGRANTKTILGHADLLVGKVNTSLSAINSTIATIGKTSVETANKHYENSTKFYSTATEELAKQTGYLTMIHDLLKERFAPTESNQSKSKNRYSNVVGYDGVPDLKEYANVIKENFKESTYVSLASSMMSMMGSFGGAPAMLRSVLSSPISSLMKIGARGAVSSVLGKDFAKFNKSLSGVFGTMMVKLNKKSNDFGIGGFLAELFGIKPNQKRNIDTSKYNKGRVDWNGKDEKALREVIPTQLSLIISALTGQEAKIFNYDTGKWTTYKQLQTSFKTDVKNISRRATGDIQNKFEEYFLEDNKDRNITRSSKAFHTFKKDSQNFFHYLTMHNDRIPTNDREWRELEKRLKYLGMFADVAGDQGKGNPAGNGIMLYSNFRKIRQYYKRNEQTGRRYLNTITNGQLLSGRNDIAQYYQNQENDPASMYGQLFSGATKNAFGQNDKNIPKIKNHFLNSMVDDKGNNLFYYMQQFFINLEKIAYNTANYSGGPGGGNRRSSRTNNKKFEVPDNNPKNKNKPTPDERWTEVSDTEATKRSSGIREEHKSEADKWKEKFDERMKKVKETSFLSRFGKPGQLLQDLLMIPAKHVSKILDKADENIYELLYGDTQDRPGILAKISQGFDDTFKKIKESAKNAMNDVFSPLATVFGDKLAGLFGYSSFKDMRAKMKEGLLNSDFVKGVKSNLKGAWNWAKSGVKDAVFDTGDYFTNGAFTPGVGKVLGMVKGFRTKGEAPQAARGGVVTKTGMVSVSEGEMIIPSEKNPFYTKPTNKTSQVVKEKYNASRYEALGGEDYWGEYARGGKARNRKKKGNKSLVRRGKGAARRARAEMDKARRYAETTAEDIRETAEDTIADIRETEGYKKISASFDFVSDIIKERGLDVIDRLFGSNHDENGSVIDKDTRRDNTRNKVASGWNEVKTNAKSIAAGGIIGGGVSLLTGMVGGPLVGAAVGAATALTINSQKFQETLFGKDIVDENGKKVGRDYGSGFFGKRTSEFLEKKFPQMAKFGLAGGLGGLLGALPGGPVGGMILGSALNFVIHNDNIKNYLFGEEGLFEGGDKKIKSLLPKVAGGAALGAIAGPFGLVGNMMLGGAIGFATDTNKFREAIFGIEDSDGNLQGGLLGVMRDQIIDPMKNYVKGGMQKFEDYMKEYIFDPFADLFKPLGNLIGHTINRAADFIKGKITDHVVKPMAEKISKFFQPLTNITGKMGKGAINIAANLLKIPGMGARKIGQQLDYSAVRKGHASYKSAEERYQLQDDFALRNVNYKTKGYDKFAATADYDTLRKNKDAIDLYEKAQKNATLASRDIKQGFYNTISADTGFETSGRESKLLRNAFNKYSDDGNMDHVKNTIAMLTKNGKLSEEQAGRLLDRANDTQSRLQQIKNNDLTKLKEEAESAATGMGFKGLSDIDPTTKRLLMADINDKKKQAESGNKGKSKDKKDGEAPLGSVVLDTRDHTLLDSILHPVQEIKDIHNRSVTFLNDIRDGIFKLAGIDIPTDDTEGGRETSQSAKALSEAAKEEAAATSNKHPSASDIVSGNNKTGETITKVDDNGNVVRYVDDGKGNLEPDVRDSGTKNALKEQEEEKSLRHKFYDSMTGFKSTLADVFLGKKDDDGEDEKKSLLSGLLGGVANIGSNLLLFGKNIASLAVGIGKFGIIASILVKLFGGKKGEDALNNIENAATNRRSDEEYEETGDERDEYLSDHVFGHASKNLIMKGQGKLIPGSKVFKGARNKVIDFTKKNADSFAVKGAGLLVRASKTKLGSKIAQTNIGKRATRFASSIVTDKTATKAIKNTGLKLLGKVTNTTAGAFAYKVGSEALETVTKLKGGLKEKFVSVVTSAFKFLKPGAGEAIKAAAEKGAQEVVEEASKRGLKSVGGKLLKSIVAPVNLVFAAGATLSGWKNANFILEIIEKPSLGERFIAAVVNGLNELIPGIGGIIPSKFIINVVLGILSAMNMAPKGLMEKRQKAQEELAKWNEENPDRRMGSVSEYLKNVEEMDDGGIVSSLAKGAINFSKLVVKAPFNMIKKGVNILSGGKLFNEKEEKKEEKEQNPELANSGADMLRSMEQNNLKNINAVTTYKVPQASTYLTGGGSSSSSSSYGAKSNGPTVDVKMVGGASGIVKGVPSSVVPTTIMNMATSSMDRSIGQISVPDFTSLFNNMLTYMDPEKKKDITGLTDALSKTGQISENTTIGSTMGSIITKVMGSMMLPMVTVFRSMNALGNLLTGKSAIGGEAEQMKKAITEDTKKGGFLKKVGNWFGGLFKNDETTEEPVGAGSGAHVPQNDPSYANRKFGKSTLGQNGCGPAVAATVLRQYGKPTSIDQTAGYALAKGYVAGASGTRASYFSDVLGRNGIQSQYTNNGNDIRKAVSTGKPTILLGQNNANRSKTNSPFGPNPHYVVAQGTKNGNVVVNDPELGAPALYRSNILKNAKLGIMTGGDSKINQNDVSDITKEINRKAAANSGGANKEVVGDDGTITSGNGDYIGKYVKKFESGNKGSDMISSGKGDYGGVSFGSYQFPSYGDAVTKKGNLPLFWNTYFASQYPGVQPGNNDKFKAAWKSAVAKNPADFFNKEHEFVAKQYYDSIASELGKNGVGDPTSYNRAAQEAAWSSAVQYGPVSAANLFKASGISNAMDPSLYVAKLYAHKINTIPTKFKSSSQAVRDSIKNRYVEEQKIILGLTGQKPIDPHSTNGAIAGNGVTSSGSTYGSSGTTSNSSSGSFDIGSILDNALGNIFGNVFSKIGKVGEIFSKVFGFTKEDSSVDGTTDPNSSSSASVGESGGSVSGDKANNFPYFRQADERWGNVPYGKSGTIASSGCGPTSMAMVLQSYGKNVTPKDTAAWSAKNGYRVEGNGTSWGFFNAIGKTEGIETKQFSEINTAKQFLNSGVPVIGSMKPGDFTKGGHFIVFSGLNGDTLAVNDPANTGRTTKRWDANNALGQAKQFWAFTKDNKGSLPATNTSAGAAAQQQSSNNMIGTGSGIIDFTKRTDYSRNDITRIPVSREIGKVTSHINAIGGDSGTLSTGNQELLKLMVEYLQIIAQNTTANTNIKTIVEILQSIMKIMPDKSSITNAATSAAVQTSAALSNTAGPGNTNSDMKIEAEMKSIMTKLQQLAKAV